MKSYRVTLYKVDLNSTHKYNRKFFLYADFNVLNYLYEIKKTIPDELTLYYDSTGVLIALWLSGYRKLEKQVSTDILFNSMKKFKKAFMFGGTAQTLFSAKAKILENNSLIQKVDIHNGYNYNNETILKRINSGNYDVIYLGLGLGRQEEWIFKYYKSIQNGIVFTTGGWFEYLAGEKRRAPYNLRRLHLEWFYKMLKEFPRIWHRYLIGFPKFLFRVVTKRIILAVR